jgi:hypothetical protein
MELYSSKSALVAQYLLKPIAALGRITGLSEMCLKVGDDCQIRIAKSTMVTDF